MITIKKSLEKLKIMLILKIDDVKQQRIVIFIFDNQYYCNLSLYLLLENGLLLSYLRYSNKCNYRLTNTYVKLRTHQRNLL